MNKLVVAVAMLVLPLHLSSAQVASRNAPTSSSQSGQETRRLTVDSTIGELLDNQAARSVLANELPAIVSSPQIDMARRQSLRSLQPYAPTLLTDARLKAIDEELARTPGAFATGSAKPLAPQVPADTQAALRLNVIKLWEGRAPHATGDAPQDTPTLTVVGIDGAISSGTAVIVAPGGGYVALATGHEGRQVADWFAAHGITAFVLTYRLASAGYHHPTQLEDAQRAVRWVRAHANEYGVAPNRIGMIGFSAGGHLTAMVSTRFDAGNAASSDPVERVSSRPDFAVLVYAGTIWGDDGWTPEPIAGTKANASMRDELSPARHVTSQTPPTFLLHTNADIVVPAENAVAYYRALRAAKVPAEMHIFENGPHGIGFALSDPALSEGPVLLQNWLRQRGLIYQPN